MTNRILLLSIIVFSFLLSCEEDELNYPQPDAVSPHITSIIPDAAYIGNIVTIIGRGFGTTQVTSKVSFTGSDAIEYSVWNNTVIIVKVPVGAQSGKVSVTVMELKSNEVDFWVKTSPPKPVTVKIGDQVWMTKNLDVDHYRNGDSIPQVKDSDIWVNLKTGAWCYYNNDPAMGKMYGKLYNWYAVNDPRGLASEGWHIPSDAEWKELEMCLGMSQSEADKYGDRGANVGGKLKSTGTIDGGDVGATNEIEFSAHPGGNRSNNGTFSSIGDYGDWWSSTANGETKYAWRRYLNFSSTNISRYYNNKGNGFSVRCVRD